MCQIINFQKYKDSFNTNKKQKIYIIFFKKKLVRIFRKVIEQHLFLLK